MFSGDLERLRHALKPAFLWDVGRRRLVWANAAAVRFFRARSLAELVERPFDAREAGVRALDEAARDLAAAAGTAASPPQRVVELLFPSAGRDEPLPAVVRPHLLADGRPGLLVVAEEVDAGRLAPPSMLSGILDEMPQPVVALDAAGALAYANAAALELLDESRLAALSGVFPTRTAALDFLARAREAGTAVITREANTNIGRRTLRLVARTAHDGDLVIVMIDDLTDRLAAERMQMPFAPGLPATEEEGAHAPLAAAEAEAGERPPAAPRADELEALRRLAEELSARPGDGAERAAETETPPTAGKETAEEEKAPARLEPAAETASETATRAAETEASSAPAPTPTPPHESGARITIRVKPKAEAPTAAEPPRPPAAAEAGAEPSPEAGVPEESESAPAPERAEESERRRVAVRISGALRRAAEEGGEEAASEEREERPPAHAGAAEEKAAETAHEPAKEAADEAKETPAAERETVEEAREDSGNEEAAVSTAETEGVAERETAAREEDAASAAGEERTARDGHAPQPERAGRPEPPSLVREVLDHRPEPIILHRADAFYFANRAARELFGFAPEDAAWDDIAHSLAAAAEGEDVLLPDAEGTLHRFRLKRDVFPWRAGVVVQSTLLPAEADRPERQQGAGKRKAGGAADAERDVTAGLEKLREQVRAVASRAPAPVIRIHAHPRRQPSREDSPESDASAFRSGRSPAAGPLPEAAPTAQEDERAPREAPGSEPASEDATLRAVLEAASEGVITLNERGEILSFSAGAAELFGFSAAEALGRPFHDLLEEDSRPALQSRLEALREGAEDGAHARDRGREVNARRPDGEQVTLFMTIGMLERRRPVADEHTARYCVLVRDITPFKRRERELEAARDEAERQSARKSEFLARISHELRTPLNAILGFSDVLRQELFGKLGNEKYLDYARNIHESGEHLLSLVNDLLDLARIEAGRFQVQFTEVDLAGVVRETTRLLRDQAQEEEMDLREVIPDDLPKVVADARSVKQILINLLSNAIKYGRKGGRVVVALRQLPEGGLELSVKDDGPGMSEEELERALEPFSRVERTGEGKPGTGLGLPLARALAEANKARFEVKSAPGEGTVARVVFPPHRVLA